MAFSKQKIEQMGNIIKTYCIDCDDFRKNKRDSDCLCHSIRDIWDSDPIYSDENFTHFGKSAALWEHVRKLILDRERNLKKRKVQTRKKRLFFNVINGKYYREFPKNFGKEPTTKEIAEKVVSNSKKYGIDCVIIKKGNGYIVLRED